MGCALSSAEQKESLQRSKDIDSRLAYDHKQRSREIKLLLLGELLNLCLTTSVVDRVAVHPVSR